MSTGSKPARQRISSRFLVGDDGKLYDTEKLKAQGVKYEVVDSPASKTESHQEKADAAAAAAEKVIAAHNNAIDEKQKSKELNNLLDGLKENWLPWTIGAGSGLVAHSIASSVIGDGGNGDDSKWWKRLLARLVPLGIGGLGAYGGYRLGEYMKTAQAKEPDLSGFSLWPSEGSASATSSTPAPSVNSTTNSAPVASQTLRLRPISGAEEYEKALEENPPGDKWWRWVGPLTEGGAGVALLGRGVYSHGLRAAGIRAPWEPPVWEESKLARSARRYNTASEALDAARRNHEAAKAEAERAESVETANKTIAKPENRRIKAQNRQIQQSNDAVRQEIADFETRVNKAQADYDAHPTKDNLKRLTALRSALKEARGRIIAERELIRPDNLEAEAARNNLEKAKYNLTAAEAKKAKMGRIYRARERQRALGWGVPGAILTGHGTYRGIRNYYDMLKLDMMLRELNKTPEGRTISEAIYKNLYSDSQ